MNLRTFPPQVEQLARQWRGEVLTSSTWTQVGDVIEHFESEPFFVRSSEGAAGLAKPGTVEPPVHQLPRAAHEKIASDLAFDLGLPVPPVLLWSRSGAGPKQQRYASISTLAFPRANPWAMAAGLSSRLLPRLAAVASAMAVFDSWVANTDRQNDGNLLVSEDDSVSPPVLRVAYLDFANSLAYRWGKGERWWKLEEGVACYPDGVPLDVQSMGLAIGEIERFPPATLREIVNRIPGSFLSEQHRTAIREGLSYRQSRIRGIMTSMYPGIP
ncbi:hypothetical protein F0U59_06385 [Archangium gephyra]|nr:hypothetical protein F0U59_06385 [Archangium gephyra]